MHAHTLRQGWLAVLKHFIMCVQTKIYTSSCPLSRGHTGHVTTCITEVSHISTCWLQRTPACDWLQGINHSNETRKRSQNDSHACEAAGRLRPLLLVGVINSVSTQEADRLNMYDNNPDVLCVQSVHMWQTCLVTNNLHLLLIWKLKMNSPRQLPAKMLVEILSNNKHKRQQADTQFFAVLRPDAITQQRARIH